MNDIDLTLILLWGISAFLLAIVCANLANLLLARNLSSAKEIAIRAALGASPLRILRLHLAEALLLAIAGGLGGVLVSMWGTAAFLALRPLSLSLVYPATVTLDATAVLYGLGLSILIGVLIGLGPSLRSARPSPLLGVMRHDPHVQGGIGARWLFGAAVAAQTAMAVVLTLGAALMASSYLHLMRTEPGFDPENAVRIAVQLDSPAYGTVTARREFFGSLLERIRGVSGVVDAAIASDVPPHSTVLGGAIETDSRPGEPVPGVNASWVHVTPAYFRVMRIPHLEGRVLIDEDWTTAGVLVSHSFARKYWPGESAVGQRFRPVRADGSGRWFQVVGVVGDVTGRGLRDSMDEIYLPYGDARAQSGSIVARVDRRPEDLMQAMREQVWAIDPNVPVGRIETLSQALAHSIDDQTFYTGLLGASSLLALVLAGIGVAGVVAYAAAQRRREIGIRIALGAQAVQVERLVALQGVTPAVAGVLAGLVGGVALSGSMSGLVHGVSVTEPSVYATTAVVLVTLSLLSAWLPARRATRADPLVALRSE